MSIFNSIFANSAAALRSYAADPGATYLAFGSAAAPIAIDAVPGPEMDRVLDTEEGRMIFELLDRGPLVASPDAARGDQITLSTGVVWSVENIESLVGDVLILAVSRPTTVEMAGRNYRNKT